MIYGPVMIVCKHEQSAANLRRFSTTPMLPRPRTTIRAASSMFAAFIFLTSGYYR
jgi:hypothetical protein